MYIIQRGSYLVHELAVGEGLQNFRLLDGLEAAADFVGAQAALEPGPILRVAGLLAGVDVRADLLELSLLQLGGGPALPHILLAAQPHLEHKPGSTVAGRISSRAR